MVHYGGVLKGAHANGDANSAVGQAEDARVALVAVPYAMKAKDADTIGGLPPSAFVLAGPTPPATAVASGAKAEAARDVSPDTACTKISSDGTATANQVTKFTAACAIEPSAVFESGGQLGIGTTTPAAAWLTHCPCRSRSLSRFLHLTTFLEFC